MLYVSLEERLGLPHGLVSTVMKRGVETQYSQFLVTPKRQLIRRANRALKSRMIVAPHKELKLAQRAIARLISSEFTAHPIAHAYKDGRSILSNARQHLGAHSILKVDLVNFFGSVSQQSVIDALRSLLDDCSDRDIKAMADLCCYDGYLPQGSPASPVLSNLVCFPLDVQLDELARHNGCKVTRFSDDITFSTSARAFPPALAQTWKIGLAYGVELERPICSLLERHRFVINSSKLKFQARPRLLKITGLIVNDGVSVPGEFWHNLRAGLHQWKQLGPNACARIHTKGCIVAFTNSLRGSIEYIGHIQGRDCNRYRRALAAFEELRSRDRQPLMAATQSLAAARKAADDNVVIRRKG